MKTVLIVDDSKFMRTWLKNMFRSNGYKVIAEAQDGLEATEQYKNFAPDIVFLDITMPIMDGLTALYEIMKIDSNANVYMCSSLGTQSNVIRALQYGAKDFIVKPNFNHLFEILEK